ncbi:leucine-rich_repeat protein [Hexamita inflata]|uniref:Leucine-rich repeat protein n=1 Tax=Hexamita inflata TaxID=28002 RepID=A0AA86UJ20_9EUKA|nr:leucine-rich repeat protein [Hexamita inflata]
MKQLQYINLCNNTILIIEPIKDLKNLKQLLINQNVIHDIEFIKSDWIYCQKPTFEIDYINYIKDTGSLISPAELKTILSAKKKKTDELIGKYVENYNNEMINKFKNYVEKREKPYGRCLEISNNTEVRDINFVKKLGVTDLRLKNCRNAHLLRAPDNLECLTNDDSDLKSLKGVEMLSKLKFLSIENAKLVSVDSLRNLKNLDKIYLNQNKILLNDIEKLKKELPNCEINANDQKEPTQEEINESRLW